MAVPEGQLSSLHSEIQELRGQVDRQAELQAELQADARSAHEARHRAEQACAESVRQAEAEAADLRLQVRAPVLVPDGRITDTASTCSQRCRGTTSGALLCGVCLTGHCSLGPVFGFLCQCCCCWTQAVCVVWRWPARCVIATAQTR